MIKNVISGISSSFDSAFSWLKQPYLPVQYFLVGMGLLLLIIINILLIIGIRTVDMTSQKNEKKEDSNSTKDINSKNEVKEKEVRILDEKEQTIHNADDFRSLIGEGTKRPFSLILAYSGEAISAKTAKDIAFLGDTYKIKDGIYAFVSYKAYNEVLKEFETISKTYENIIFTIGYNNGNIPFYETVCDAEAMLYGKIGRPLKTDTLSSLVGDVFEKENEKSRETEEEKLRKIKKDEKMSELTANINSKIPRTLKENTVTDIDI